MNDPSSPEQAGDAEYPEWYYDLLARTMGEEKAAWARLPPREREAELTALHRAFDTPDDLSVWPAELDGGCDRP
ncbi:MAG: hypothetical protein ACKOEM_08665 [Planctomycetia bacterium]|jgi:hypothetical protein